MSNIVFAPNAVANFNAAATVIKGHLAAARAAAPKSAARRKARALANAAINDLTNAYEAGQAASSVRGEPYFDDEVYEALVALGGLTLPGNKYVWGKPGKYGWISVAYWEGEAFGG